MVSSWFSCSLIDQQHWTQWAQSKWELNRLHQGFVALCSLPAWGSKFSHHRAGWSPGLLQIALCFTPVSWLALCFAFFFPSSSTICPCFLPCPVLSSVVFFSKAAAACRWKLWFFLFFFSGVSWKVGRPGTDNPSVCLCVCLCVCTCALANTSRTVKVSSFPLCRPFDGMKERGGAVYTCSSAV